MLIHRIYRFGKQILLAVIITCLLTAMLLTSACSSPEHSACIKLMRKVPAGYQDFEFWDVAALRDKPDLAGMYEKWREKGGRYRDIISDVDVKYLGPITTEGALTH